MRNKKKVGIFMKFSFLKNSEKEKDEKPVSCYDDELLHDIAITKSALDAAYSNFENVVDPDLIDCYIHEVIAVQMRYKFLLKHAKEQDRF